VVTLYSIGGKTLEVEVEPCSIRIDGEEVQFVDKVIARAFMRAINLARGKITRPQGVRCGSAFSLDLFRDVFDVFDVNPPIGMRTDGSILDTRVFDAMQFSPSFPKMWRDVIWLYYGLGCTFDMCGHVLGITRQRAHQIKNLAVKELSVGARRNILLYGTPVMSVPPEDNKPKGDSADKPDMLEPLVPYFSRKVIIRLTNSGVTDTSDLLAYTPSALRGFFGFSDKISRKLSVAARAVLDGSDIKEAVDVKKIRGKRQEIREALVGLLKQPPSHYGYVGDTWTGALIQTLVREEVGESISMGFCQSVKREFCK